MQEVAGANGATRPGKAAQKPKEPAEKPPETAPDPFAALRTVELSGMKLPANVMFSNAVSSLVPGTRYSTSLSLDGIIARLRWVVDGGYVVVDVLSGGVMRYVVVTQSGAEAVCV